MSNSTKIKIPQYLSFEVKEANKVFYTLQDVLNSDFLDSPVSTDIKVMTNLKKRIDDKKDEYEIVVKMNPQTAQKIGWWINPLNKNIKDVLRRDYGVNQPSNGFLKMFEMLSRSWPYSLKVAQNGKVRAFGNAELPGAMLFAANHFYMQNKIDFDFVFSSLVDPNEPNKLGDQYGMVKKYPNKFIPSMDKGDWTGDVSDPKEVRHIVESIPEKVDLYFADGGINVSEDFNNQDVLNTPVNLGQIICGLLTLKKGGMFITKQYNFTNSATWTLNLLVASLFNKFSYVKPSTSRHSNSEVYLIGIDFVGIYPKLEKYLYNFLEKCHLEKNYVRNILPPNDLTAPTDIQKKLIDDFDIFMSQLIHYTKEAIYKHDGKVGFLAKKIDAIAIKATKDWISQNRIKPIPREKNLI